MTEQKKIDFKNTIVAMASNADQKAIIKGNYEKVNNELEKHFRIEFLNRIAEIVKFNTIKVNQLSKKL